MKEGEEGMKAGNGEARESQRPVPGEIFRIVHSLVFGGTS